MRVVASRVIRVGGAIAGAVGTAAHPLDRREGLVLVLTSDTGLEGIGEASPLPGYSPDTIDEAAEALDGIHASLTPLHPERAQRVEGLTVESAFALAAPLLENVPSARFAVETALLDLLGRSLGAPVHRLFRDALAKPIPRSALLPPPSDARTIAAAHDAIRRGIRTLKLKLGARPFDVSSPRSSACAKRSATPSRSGSTRTADSARAPPTFSAGSPPSARNSSRNRRPGPRF